MNLIPESPGKTPNYWCTWGLQNYLSENGDKSYAFGLSGHSLTASKLTEMNIQKHAFNQDFLLPVRKDLIVVFDLGWDIPEGANIDMQPWLLGSQVVAESKFPSCSGNPVEKLRKLNDLTRHTGWKGAGIWVPAHAFGESKAGMHCSQEQLKQFFRERMRWSQQAGIKYWKVDYGLYCQDDKFRKMLTETAKEEAPELLIEHARNGGPINDTACPWDTKNVTETGFFSKWDNGLVLQQSINKIKFSDIFRTYDVSASLSIPTTLDRVAALLHAFSETDQKCILNCESEPYIGAVLGCAIGIISSKYQNNITTHDASPYQNYHLDQFIRAIRWQRIAPAWGVGIGKNETDEHNLSDTWDFRKGSDWVDYLGVQKITQRAPARVSRGMALPKVHGDDIPYVVCSKNPDGYTAVASLPRISVDRGKYYPQVNVSMEITSLNKPVGIFGKYESVSLELRNPLKEGEVILAQDLAQENAVDITHCLILSENKITIPGHLMEKVCGTTRAVDDIPAIMLVAVKRH